jgi:hypothetical protein
MRRKNKKAQIAGEVLIYILAIVVFSLTLLYGYKAVKYFSAKSNDISYMELENQIKNAVEKANSDNFGTIKKTVLQIPGDFRQVCLVNTDIRGQVRTISTDYKLIFDALGNTDNNLFLYPPGSTGFNIGDIEIDDTQNWQCVNITGNRVTLKLESMGDHVKVSKWQ